MRHGHAGGLGQAAVGVVLPVLATDGCISEKKHRGELAQPLGSGRPLDPYSPPPPRRGAQRPAHPAATTFP